MSRQRKTWISDAYAERQAAFMQLPPARVRRPLRRTLNGLVSYLPKNPSMEAVKLLQVACRPIIKAAKRGDGGEVRRLAAAFA